MLSMEVSPCGDLGERSGLLKPHQVADFSQGHRVPIRGHRGSAPPARARAGQKLIQGVPDRTDAPLFLSLG
jgi:hypothetical protein